MFLKSLVSLFILSLISGCSPKSASLNADSSTKGHYENSSIHIFSQSGEVLRVPAEYEPSRAVILSLPVINRFNKIAMVQALASLDIDKIWIVVPSDFEETLETGESFADLREALEDKISKVELIKHKIEGKVSVWSRDWAPLGAVNIDGDLRLLDFNYYSNRPADDYTAQIMEQQLALKRVSVPVYNEGGNFMINTRGDCFLTSRVTDANAKAERRDDIVQGADDLVKVFKEVAGCQSVQIFPRMPYEQTGHIDMWAKFVNDETVVVAEIPNAVMDLYEFNTDRTKAKSIQSYLDDRAREIQDLGYRVKRIPMPMPIFRKRATFRSYTDAQIVNGTILVPRYQFPADPTIATENNEYFDKGFIAGYERDVREAYESLGYKMTWVDSDDLIYTGGAVHCAVMQVPR